MDDNLGPGACHGIGKSRAIPNVAFNVRNQFANPGHLEQAGIGGRGKRIARNLRAQVGEPQAEPGAFEARMAGEEDPPPRPECSPSYHVFQGALCVIHNSSRTILSRSVSIGCQKPL